MPGVSKAQRAEAKYNVVLDFPDYGLHSAAVSGNLGLVKYALDHGQPVNSALDGVLPLHAACSGGNDLVVRLLIEAGADVNAPRLPRRYSNDKHRNVVAQLTISGASGSTPLHFAAAHGHTNVVLTLLLHGAHPDRPDKHGITPEMLARQNGFPSCADVLREWCHNKDKDLREREAMGSYYPEDQTYREKESHPYCGSLDCRECATRKRIRMKRSIDNAIHILRHSSSHSSNLATPPHSATINSNEPPSPLDRPLGEYTFYNSPDSTVIEELPPRRPSLPQVLEIPHHAVPTSHRSRRPSNLSTTSTHRPRSAGNDAEPSTAKVKGKISLLSLFKKGNDTTDSISSYNSSSSAVTSASTSPAGVQTSALAMTSLGSRSTDMLASTLQEQTAAATTQPSPLQHRLFSDTNEASPSRLEAPVLHHTHSRDSLRGQSTLQPGEPLTKGNSPVRPGILRSHGRSSSSGLPASQTDGGVTRSSSIKQAPGRSLRFDPSPSDIPSRRSESQPHSHVRQRSRDSRSNSLRSHSPGTSLWGARVESEPDQLTASPVPLYTEGRHEDIEEVNEDVLEKQDEEEEYGHPVKPQVGIGHLKTRLSNLHPGDNATISPATDTPDSNKLDQVFECPFSINRPPVEEPPSPGLDTRTRGDSLSSMATDTSGGPPSSYVPTPSLEQCNLPTPIIASPSSPHTDLPPTIDITPEKQRGTDQVVTPLSGGRPRRTTLDIDIRNISSHAQAEELVQRAAQRIFDLDNDDDDYDEEERKSLGLGDGHTPLSARLAAYGESLAIERRFKAEEKRKSLLSQSSSDNRSPSENTFDAHVKAGDESRGLNRQFSLSGKAEAHGAAGRSFDEQRPHSSGGTPSSGSRDMFLSADRLRSNVLSTSNPENPGRLYAATVSSHSLVSPPTAHHHHHHKMRSETLPGSVKSSLPRSRTPDPDATLRVSQSALFGAPLTRYPTCPAEDAMHELVPRKSSLSNQARQAARAQKLARMGFVASGESWREASDLSRGNKHRFGGIRTLVQSITGRT